MSVTGVGNQTQEDLSIDTVRRAVNLSDAATMENNFISLMVAQIQNQDPTNPLDSSEFLTQYSAMSQVKSMENMVSLGQNNLVLLDNLQTLSASSLVGQEVKVSVEHIEINESAVTGSIEFEHASQNASLVLTDSLGITHEVALGAVKPGSVPFSFDPKAYGLVADRYRVEVKADSGEYPAVQVAGTVGRVRVSNEGPVLEVAGVGSVPFYNITEFGQGRSTL